MGEIVIEVPHRMKRRYVLTSKKSVEALIAALDRSALKLSKNPDEMAPEELEDFKDYLAAQNSIDEMQRTGKSHRWEDVKLELGL